MLKPWREIAKPHKDVLEGTFKQSEFAADISQVAAGKATPEYQDAEKFFRRTFITEGMRLLLISVAQRLAGQGGDPVIQLQTAFGGGKTHTMLAVYHLATRGCHPGRSTGVSTDQLEGIPPILDEANIPTLPQAHVAVIDGIKISPSQPLKHGDLEINTIWGELAWQLLGEEGYEMVASADQDGTSPGKEVLTELIRKAAPCVILIDELVAFTRQFELGKQFKAGTFDSNISFIQGLTEALKAVPNALLLASLPESELEVGGTIGQRALNSLEKYFARVESVWKPVATEEAFEIVRRRLFDTIGDPTEKDAVCRAFADFYRENSDKFPIETQDNNYYERLKQSYPIHPEIFDRLYEDWSTLEKFQRTRGVLQYMAMVIHRLWNSDNRDALIMPGSLPLDDSNVRNKSIHYLPQGWEPVIEKEVDGHRSEPAQLDSTNTLYGSVHAARRAARTIFLGSAPSSEAQMVRGIKAERILLGSVQPGQTIGVFEDVMKRLRDRLHYLYSDQDRFWLDTKPNLRREMESRKLGLDDTHQVQPLLKDHVSKAFGRPHVFAGIHIFTPSVDIPDDIGNGPRLIVLPPNAPYSRGEYNQAFPVAEEILKNRGSQPRQKQNRLIFLASDYDVVGRLRDQAKTYLAWQSIVDDIENEKLNLDLFQTKQARSQKEGAQNALHQLVRETYKWLLCPMEEFQRGKLNLEWEVVSISPAAPNLAQAIETKLREEEWLIVEWSPIHLKNMLAQWYFKDGQDINVSKVWHDTCQYLYLPRLVNEQVFKDALTQGVQSEDYFGYASGKEGDKYLGFAFGKYTSVNLDSASVLIEKEAAIVYMESIKPPPPPPVSPIGESSGSETQPANIRPETYPSVDPIPAKTEVKKHFYGTIELDPVGAKMQFADIINEVVEHFSTRTGVNVSISVEIQADSSEGFDEGLQRTIKENCSVLRFGNAEFEG